MNVLYYATDTTLNDLEQFWNVTAQGIYREASRLGLDVMGPVYWMYFGADGKPDTVFRLEISLPVSEAVGQPEGFAFKQWESFKCLTDTHLGSWDNLNGVYNKLMPTIFQEGYQPIGISREMYLNMDLKQPENNVTEIQIGIN